VADGDDDILTVKIASQLNGCMSTVKVGSVIELLQFSRGFLPRVPNCPELVAVLVSSFVAMDQFKSKTL
jgi:hypothetical protein